MGILGQITLCPLGDLKWCDWSPPVTNAYYGSVGHFMSDLLVEAPFEKYLTSSGSVEIHYAIDKNAASKLTRNENILLFAVLIFD